MTDLQHAGYFKELPHGDPAALSIRDLVRQSADPDAVSILAYLSGGTVIATTSLYFDDCLDPTRRQIAPLDIRTDGTWVWPSDLAYYVATYHIQIPPAFLEHMRKQGWHLPRLTDEEALAIEEALFPNQF